MANWASPILRDWSESPSARLLTTDEEAACADQVASGCEARDVLMEKIVPSVEAFLQSVAGDGEFLRCDDVCALAKRVVRAALQSFATSREAIAEFPSRLSAECQREMCEYFDRRHQLESSFWVQQDEWLGEHLDDSALANAVNSSVFGEATLWKQLTDTGTIIHNLVRHGFTVIPSVVDSLRGHGVELLTEDDAEGQAALKLCHVAWEFRRDKGSFRQIAYSALKNHLTSACRKAQGRKEGLARDLDLYGSTKAELWLRLQRCPKVEEVLAHIDEWGDRKKESFRKFLEIADSVPDNWDGDVQSLEDEFGEPVEEAMAREQRAHLLRAAVRQLDQDTQTVLTHLYGHGLTITETARRLGTNRTAVGRKRDKALETLRRICRQLVDEH